MRIVLTTHQFLPDYYAGTEILTYSVARELLARGHEVAVFTGHPAKNPMPDERRFDEYEIDGLRVHRFHHAFVPLGAQKVIAEIEYNNHLASGYFKGILERFKPDVVHFFHFSRLGVALVDVVADTGIPAYYTPTDFWAVCPLSQLLLPNGRVCPGPSPFGGNCVRHVGSLGSRRRRLIRSLPQMAVDGVVALARSRILPNFPHKGDIRALSIRAGFTVARLNMLNGIVAPTQLMADVLIRNGVNADLITRSAYGIDVTGFDTVREGRVSDSVVHIGYIGTLGPHKGCDVLIRAFNGLREKSARLHVYGDEGHFPSYVKDLHAAADGNDAITFRGTFANADIGRALAGLDVLVVPSVWYENAPLVVYSALAAKRPVIASNFPGLSEVVQNERNGLLFEPRNATALERCLRRLFREPGLLERLGANCKPPKSIARYVDELMVLYAKKDGAARHLNGQQAFLSRGPSCIG